ncbi:MAG TPA: glycosyltransferase family 39 protein [Vicinamibacterales bacterium]|nr:glycosyltransferase family 39 protein [Vicinamibacterales bacterium]
MESSRTRNSILDWLLAASLALAVLAALAGIDFRIGTLAVRSHSATRLLVATAVLLLLRWRMGVPFLPPWLMRIGLLTAITGSVFCWFRFLVTTVGGADSYGYASAAELIADGRLIAEAPIAEWISASNRLAVASPLGWAPAPNASGIAPTYPLGLPLLMALFSLAAGSHAVFFVSPAVGVITLALVYRLARDWYDEQTALFATALVAWNPLVIAYAKQPMSDMAATMWLTLALVLSLRSSKVAALFGGLAAGAAVITRPALLIAAALIPLMVCREDGRRTRVALAAVGLATALGLQMAIQNHLFGSPFATGYGTAANLFSTDHLPTNLGIFAAHGWRVVGPLWIPGLIIGVFAARPEPRWKPAALFGAALLPYLFYLPFDHWETLRFLLPGLVPLTVVVADGLIHLARMSRRPAVTAVAVIAFTTMVAGPSEYLLRTSSAWDIASIEARYPLAGEWINVNTPPESVVLANQHSGSLRWYGRRQTLRWDFLAPQDLAKTVSELQARGATVYVALEGDEVAMFDGRFAGVIDRLQVDHVGRVRNVSFRRLIYFPNR